MSDSAKLSTKKSKQLSSATELNEQTEQVDTPTTNRKSRKTKLQTISPFLSPRSSDSYERSSTPTKSARSSLQGGARAQSSAGNRKSLFGSFASSPSVKQIRKSKTDQSSTIEKNLRPASAFGQQFAYEHKRVSDQMKHQGSEFFRIKTESKNLEQELKSLETRVERLKKEEQNSLKRLEKTQQQCQEVVDNKLRHQNDLLESEYRKQKKMADLANQRKEQMEAKMKLNEGILKSMISTMEFKNKQKKDVKQTLADANEVYARETTEKNKIRDKMIQEIQDLRQRIVQGRKDKEEAAKEFALVTHHAEKIQAEMAKQEAINKRLEDLVQQEEALLEKIRATNTLHSSTFEKMEKIFSMRVTTDKPFELP